MVTEYSTLPLGNEIRGRQRDHRYVRTSSKQGLVVYVNVRIEKCQLAQEEKESPRMEERRARPL